MTTVIQQYKTKKKLKSKQCNTIRLFDNICYVSTSMLIVLKIYIKNHGYKHENVKSGDQRILKYYKKLLTLRSTIRKMILYLFQHNILVDDNIQTIPDEFLTYDKYDKDVWYYHLICGILNCFWE